MKSLQYEPSLQHRTSKSLLKSMSKLPRWLFLFFGWHLAEPTIKGNENFHQLWIYWIFCSRAHKPCTLFFLIRHIIDIYYPLSRKKLLWGWRRLQKLFNKEEIKQMRVGLHSKPGVPSGSWSGPLRCTPCFIRTWIPEHLSWNIKPGGRQGGERQGLRRQAAGVQVLTPDSWLKSLVISHAEQSNWPLCCAKLW